MTLREEAERVLKDRKIWGNAWDEYEPVTEMDIVRGKIQRIWNLVQDLKNEMRTNTKIITFFDSDAFFKKIEDNLVDAFNYSNHLKKRLMEENK